MESMTPTTRTDTTDAPPAGRAGGLRIRPSHPDLAGAQDPLTTRLLFLLRSNPGLVSFRADDLSKMDTPTKELLLAQLDRALGLLTPTPAVIPFDE
jgi:hypothetical protein